MVGAARLTTLDELDDLDHRDRSQGACGDDSHVHREHHERLHEELDRAHVVPATDIPPEVVTMHSRLRLRDLDTGNDLVFTLVFSSDADVDQGKISILAPLGTAVLGYRRGDTFEWHVPGRVRRLRVEEVLYQPEAAGDYHL
jgi:regulator of nucleoside diphosphate kinase